MIYVVINKICLSKITDVVVPWIRLLASTISPRRLRFVPGSVHVGFVMDKVTMWRFYFELFGFPLSVSFHAGSSYSYTARGINNWHLGGSSSET
jgi:hypothetical protein